MANTIHGVVRTDNMFATNASAGLYSVRFYDGDAEAAIDNGCVVKLDSLLPGERELYKGVAPAADTALNDVVLLAAPEVMYDERLRNLTDFYNEAGTDIRGYTLHSGDIFSITNTVVDGTAAVGSAVELQASTRLKVVPTATSGSTKVGTVIALETVGSLNYVVVRVV